MQQRTHSGKHSLSSVYTKYPDEQHGMQQMEKHNRVDYTLAPQRFKSSISELKMRTFPEADIASDYGNQDQAEISRKNKNP